MSFGCTKALICYHSTKSLLDEGWAGFFVFVWVKKHWVMYNFGTPHFGMAALHNIYTMISRI